MGYDHMSKSNRSIGAVLAVLLLALLVVGLIFVVKVAYYDEPKLTEQYTEATDAAEPSATETEAPKDVRIALFETTDIHGYLTDTTSGDPTTFQYRLAYIAKVVDKARSSDKYDDVILVDGGDIYKGSVVSDLSEGAALRAAIDIMGYDAVTLGESEFAWDVKTYATDSMATVPSYEVGDITGDPGVPVIAATLYSSNNHNRTLFTKDYVIVEKAGHRIALIGYIPDFSEEILEENIEPYELHADLTEFSARIKEINETEKPDVTIVVAHENPLTVANALNHDDVDLVTGGHDNSGDCGISDSGIPYIQALDHAQGYAGATIVISSDGSVTVEETAYTSITDTPERLYDNSSNAGNFDAQVLALSHTAWDSLSDQLNEALGYIDSNVEKNGYTDDMKITTTGGNFVTGLMRDFTADSGVVAAFCNSSDICADFVVPEGEILEISVGDIYALAPFNHTWLLYDLTGEELAEVLADGIDDPDGCDQVSGLTFEYYNRGTLEQPVTEIVSIKLKSGTVVDIHDTDTKYRVVTTGNNANRPGSVFEGKTPVLFTELDAPVDNISLIDILRNRRDKGQVHIPTDDSSRGTCLNASDLLNTGDTQETSGTEETRAENTDTTGTTQEAA